MANSKFVRLYYEYANDLNDMNFFKIKSLLENNENLISYIYESFNNFISVCSNNSTEYPALTFVKRCGSVIRKCAYELHSTEGEISLEEMLSVDYDHLSLTLFDDWCENNGININEILF